MSSASTSPAATAERAEARDSDPVTLQIVNNRLETLMRLMSRTLEQLAGTEVGREAGDYSTAYMDAEGKIVAFGSAVCTHLGHEVLVVPWIYDNLGRDQVKPGDVYLSNDPYSGGSVHANDVGLLAPVFAEDTLVGWVFCDMHCGDVGGMLPGSIAPEATDVIGEAIRFPPTKIYDAGVYREDVVRTFTNNSRIPVQLQHDLGAKVGALSVGVDAIQTLAVQYGVEELTRITAALQDFSENVFRQRLSSIPDGTYEGVDYQEPFGSDDIYAARVRLTVVGDEAFLDFRGSSPSAPALINCTVAGLIGGVMGPLIQQLASGIPFNAGVMRPIHIRADKGSFIHAEFPTPVSMSTAYGSWSVQDSVYSAANLAMQASGDDWLCKRATGQWGGVNPAMIFNGVNQHGDFSVFVNMDLMGSGQGGMPELDGGRGNFTCIGGSIPSIEGHEATEPFLYLSRDIWMDSGGAGRWRGGWGMRDAVIVWGEDAGPQTGTFATGRNAVPTVGVFGGYPASGIYFGPVTGVGVPGRLRAGEMPGLDDIEEHHWDSFESLPGKIVWEGRRALHKGDDGEVFVMTFPGGGGFGDPLMRDPDAVARDVREGFVSAEAASAVYGVSLTGELDADTAATERLRDEIRQRRVRDAVGNS